MIFIFRMVLNLLEVDIENYNKSFEELKAQLSNPDGVGEVVELLGALSVVVLDLVRLVQVLLRAVEVVELELALGDALVRVAELGVLLVEGRLGRARVRG